MPRSDGVPSRPALTIEIRRAVRDDLPAIRGIVERAYEIYVQRIGRRPAPMDDDYAPKLGRIIVAAAAGVIGLIVLDTARDHVLIENVAVDPRQQGAGVGKALIGYAEDETLRLRRRELRLYTNAAMTENLEMYAHLGFREDARRKHDGFERVFLSKRISWPP